MIERICFNFLSICNMRCDFCYCAFDKSPVDVRLCQRILDRCAELDAAVVTFGGGDPLAIPDCWSLIQYAKKIGFFVHLDTNGIGLKLTDYVRLDRYVDLLGLPIDGSTRERHFKMRPYQDHFNIVVEHLDALRRCMVTLKISTMVSRINCTDLTGIARVISGYRVSRWSLYQFWNVDGVTLRPRRHALSDKGFAAAIRPVLDLSLPFPVESGTLSNRVGAYFFVSHLGQVYTNHSSCAERYVRLGSIFDDATIDRWMEVTTTSVSSHARDRYDATHRRI